MPKANVQALGAAAQNLLNMGRLESGRFALSPKLTRPPEFIPSLRPAAGAAVPAQAADDRQDLQLDAPVTADPDALLLAASSATR